MSHTARTVLAGVIFFLFVLALAADPQQQQSAPAQTPAAGQSGATESQDDVYKSSTVLKYTSRLVVVDVIATDHKGNPVTGLKRDDFVVEEDGKDQAVEVFTFQSPAQASTRALPKLPGPNIVTNAPHFDPAKSLTVLLLDGLNTDSRNQVFARDQMLKFLEKLPADQPIAVYALRSRLRLLQDFTSDPAVLKQAVMAMQSQTSPVKDNPTGSGGDHGTYSSAALAQMSELSSGILQQVQQFEQDSSTNQMDLRVDMTLTALNALARTLAGYPGRKSLIWLSQAFPINMLATSATGDPTNSSPRTALNNRDYSLQSARTASILTDAQVALYPVDIGSLVGNQVYASLSNTDSNGNYLGRTATGRGGVGGPRAGTQAMNTELNRTGVEQLGSHSTMNDLADRTGGKAFYNTNDVKDAISRTLEDGTTYYTLAYHPQNKEWNGRYRKISVKVHQSGVKLRYRQGYYAVDPEAYAKMEPRQRDAEFAQALLPEYPASTAMTFQARVFPPSEQTKNKVVINYGIDPHAILFEPAADGQHAQVDYAVAAYTKTGQPARVEVRTLTTALKPDFFEKVMKSFLQCQMQLDLPPGEYVLRLGIRDDKTGLMGTLNTSLTVPQPAAATAGEK